MKAVQVIKPFNLVTIDMPEPSVKSSHDVLIKITSGGICGSDVQIWNGTNSLATYPRIIGHEFGGIVAATGDEVVSVKPGDKVAVNPVLSCGSCYACRIGRPNVCSSLKVMGVHCDGGFSQYVVVPDSNVHRYRQDFPSTLLSLAEPYTIGVQISRQAHITADDHVFIMGGGPIGLTALQAAKRQGARVIMSDLIPQRLSAAKDMGADEILMAGDPSFLERLFAFTGQPGVPVIIDTVCTPVSLEESVRLASPAGRVVCIGLKNQPSKITMADITKKELTLVGSRLNNHRFDEVIQCFEDGSFTPQRLMTHHFHYSQVHEALKMVTEHPELTLKVVLTFE